MKKLTTLLLIAAMLIAVSLSACSTNGSSETKETTGSTTVSESATVSDQGKLSEEDEKIFDAFYENFLKLAAIPRPSHHEEKISKFLYDWAAEKGYDVHKDDNMNVIFDVTATSGRENVPLVALQAHMDMVAVADDGVKFDPENDKELLDDPSIASTSYVTRIENMKNRAAIRDAAVDNHSPYYRVGDTVFITFDVIAMRNSGSYYEPSVRPNLSRDISWDNVVLLSYANRMLSGEDSDVKNVIIDISCNQGGMVPAMLYMLDAITGKSDVEVYYANTKSHQNLAVDCDLNLDGVIDENDKSFREMGKNVAVIVSDTSFSCGNALPVYLKYLDRDVLVLGQNSGGASFVAESSTASGTRFRYSSNYSMVTRQNGEIKYVDEGIRPDIYLSTQRMYDREYVAQLVRDTFGS